MPSILLVDNQVDACNGLANLLRAVGYRVECAYNGAAAIERLQQHVDADAAVILNVKAPRLDGWQVLNWIRSADAPGGVAKLPVIVHSDLDERLWKLARQMGANECWHRGSCSLVAMCDSLEELFEGHAALPPTLARAA